AGRQQRGGGAADPRRGGAGPRRARRHDGRRGGAGRRARQRRRKREQSLMAIWLNAGSKVIVQGITGSEGTKHTRRMVASGTKVVGGVNPRKAGTTVSIEGA